MISFIVAMDQNRAIGRNNKLPWHLPADLKYFKRVTMGHPILMGRKTYESIGKPLPGRDNIVITRNPEYKAEGCTVVHSPEEAARLFDGKEVFVIGGAEIFKQFYSFADKLYVTIIHHDFEADTFFQAIDGSEWKAVSREPGIKDEKNPFDYEFVVYEKVR